MATRLNEQHVAPVPYSRARGYLREALEAAISKSKPTTLPLILPLPAFLGDIEKNVLVTYSAGQDPMHFDEPWQVHWTPEGGGPYPDFDGELTVRADYSYRSTVLELRGEYRPPLGTIGQAFDMVVGSKIASATARALLEQIALVMEERFNREESEKLNAP